MEFEAADCLAQRVIIDFDGVKINMHVCLILTQLKIKSNSIPLTDLICGTGVSPFRNFSFNTLIDLFNKTNKANFQAIVAVVIEKFKVVYFCETKMFILFVLFVCLLLMLLLL